ncbi:hypothetical protein ACFVGM_09285 [Kitasatospora purpeofusca]|uniref:hypothetical protein n=1 Tax=Kitasatospora purpeofusca TaxID=67352 RepID=UPI00369C30D0
MTDEKKYPIPDVPPGRAEFAYRDPRVTTSARWTQIPWSTVQNLAIVGNEAPVQEGGKYRWRPTNVRAIEKRGLWEVTWSSIGPGEKRSGYVITGLTVLGRAVLEDFFLKNPPAQ